MKLHFTRPGIIHVCDTKALSQLTTWKNGAQQYWKSDISATDVMFMSLLIKGSDENYNYFQAQHIIPIN
jgi:hypothetical protein